LVNININTRHVTVIAYSFHHRRKSYITLLLGQELPSV